MHGAAPLTRATPGKEKERERGCAHRPYTIASMRVAHDTCSATLWPGRSPSTFPRTNSLSPSIFLEGLSRAPPSIMADDIVIDKALFHERLASFVAKWKADKRSGDQVFQGAASIATVVGKASEPGLYQKPAAFQVRARNRKEDHLQNLWDYGYLPFVFQG